VTASINGNDQGYGIYLATELLKNPKHKQKKSFSANLPLHPPLGSEQFKLVLPYDLQTETVVE